MSNEIGNNDFDFPQLVKTMSTVSTSTTNSLNIQLSEATVLNENQINSIKTHSNTSRETIISETNASEYPIPSNGFPTIPQKHQQQHQQEQQFRGGALMATVSGLMI
ncbi:hypothetical protein INT46_008849 [Mucor plumbeus]|uniref:Uncharacterized protein n=1 Tax=Mucor plumbeus TaxID=97098 RepID=A0A8H7V7N0_9FUNG|nr:hypothetical protein INT46_008849 [Mucor plumbeus]